MTSSVVCYTPLCCMLWEERATSRPEASRKEISLVFKPMHCLMGLCLKKLNSFRFTHLFQSDVTKEGLWQYHAVGIQFFFFQESFQINFVSITVKNALWLKVNAKKRLHLGECISFTTFLFSIEEFSIITMNFCTLFSPVWWKTGAEVTLVLSIGLSTGGTYTKVQPTGHICHISQRHLIICQTNQAYDGIFAVSSLHQSRLSHVEFNSERRYLHIYTYIYIYVYIYMFICICVCVCVDVNLCRPKCPLQSMEIWPIVNETCKHNHTRQLLSTLNHKIKEPFGWEENIKDNPVQTSAMGIFQ